MAYLGAITLTRYNPNVTPTASGGKNAGGTLALSTRTTGQNASSVYRGSVSVTITSLTPAIGSGLSASDILTLASRSTGVIVSSVQRGAVGLATKKVKR